jgi:hypothetical protein
MRSQRLCRRARATFSGQRRGIRHLPVVRGTTPADLSSVQLLELGIGILRRWRPTFALRQVRPNWNVPAIALAAPYTPNAIGPHPVPQGMAAQTNMIEHNGFVYVLAQQLATAALVPERDNGGMCLFRAPAPLNPDTVWQGWAGAESGWIDLPASYPRAPDPPTCAKVLPGAFRFSWSYNPMIQQFILLGLVSGSVNQSTCPPADPTVGQSDTAFVYMTATADLPNGQFTIVTPKPVCCESIGSTIGEDPGQTGLARRIQACWIRRARPSTEALQSI